jgi:hypothetical protein
MGEEDTVLSFIYKKESMVHPKHSWHTLLRQRHHERIQCRNLNSTTLIGWNHIKSRFS